MLKPKYINELPENMINLYSQLEQDIIKDMARRIKEYNYYIPAAQHQYKKLIELGNYHSYVQKALSAYTERTEKELEELMREAGVKALSFDDSIYRRAGLFPPPLSHSPAVLNVLNAGLKRTNGLFENLTKTTANTSAKQFENALDRAYMQVVSGAFDSNTAVRNTIKDLARQGINAVEYPSGHVDTIETAVRRAVVTGVNQTALKMQETRAIEMGCDIVEVTAHAGARPYHAEWQGGIYSLSGKSAKYDSLEDVTGYGRGDGLGGWNCRHSFFPYFEGMPRTYSNELLDDYNEKKYNYNGNDLTEYEASQIQRYNERQIRRWKRQEASGVDVEQAKAKIAQWQQKQRDFIKQTGLKRQYDREQIGGRALNGLSSGKVGDTNGYSVIEKVFKLDYNNNEDIRKAFDAFSELHRASTVEHALVISPNGNAYQIKGIESTVHINLAGEDALKDAIAIHNHPDMYDMSGDCFSEDDFKFFFNYHLKELQVSTTMGRYSIQYTGEYITELEALELYKAAKIEMFNEAFLSGVAPEWEQLEIMKVLNKTMPDLIFKEL